MKLKFNSKSVLITLCLVSVGLLAGCSSKDVGVTLDQEIQDRDARISQLEKEAQLSKAELKKTQREAEAAVRRASEASANAGSAAQAPVIPANMEGEMLPPNAKAGECYARVLIPPVYETTSERVLAKEASSKIKIIPAKHEWAEEKVLVKEATSTMVEVPAVYETVSEKVLVTPAREYWKKGRGPIEKVDGSTGEIMCLVKEDAVYKTVSKRVLKTEASTREVPTPAEYSTIKVRRQVSPPKEVRTPIEAEYRTVTKQAMVEPSYMEWRQILCETNMNSATILNVQKALSAKGFNPGPLDGVYGSQTRNAVNKFQEANKLPRGALTFGTIKALGLSN